MKFYKFDDEHQEFDLEDELLYDLSTRTINPQAGGFDNDFFCTKNEHTYYFQKHRDGFQLCKFSLGTPFQKFPVDNDPFPVSSNEEMDGYFIRNPIKNYDINDLQISFLKDASI